LQCLATSPAPLTQATRGDPQSSQVPPRFTALHIASTVHGCGASATLDSDPRCSWRCEGCLLQRRLVFCQDFGWRSSLSLQLGQSLLCRPVGLAHGPDHAQLRCLDHLTLGLKIVPQPAGALKTGGVASMVRCLTPDSPPRHPSRSQTCNNPTMTLPQHPPHANTWGAFDNPAATSTLPRMQMCGGLHDT
jgi:hypothetical protein